MNHTDGQSQGRAVKFVVFSQPQLDRDPEPAPWQPTQYEQRLSLSLSVPPVDF